MTAVIAGRRQYWPRLHKRKTPRRRLRPSGIFF